MKIYKPDNVKRIGTYADNIPKCLVSYSPGNDNWPTEFAVDPKDGKIYAFVDKKGQYFITNIGSIWREVSTKTLNQQFGIT